jgi:hypothetical protein
LGDEESVYVKTLNVRAPHHGTNSLQAFSLLINKATALIHVFVFPDDPAQPGFKMYLLPCRAEAAESSKRCGAKIKLNGSNTSSLQNHVMSVHPNAHI